MPINVVVVVVVVVVLVGTILARNLSLRIMGWRLTIRLGKSGYRRKTCLLGDVFLFMGMNELCFPNNA